MRTEEHVNDNHIEWPPIHYLLSLKEAKKKWKYIFEGYFYCNPFFCEITTSDTERSDSTFQSCSAVGILIQCLWTLTITISIKQSHKVEIKIKIIKFRFCDFYVKLQQANHNSIEEMMMVDSVADTPTQHFEQSGRRRWLQRFQHAGPLQATRWRNGVWARSSSRNGPAIFQHSSSK